MSSFAVICLYHRFHIETHSAIWRWHTVGPLQNTCVFARLSVQIEQLLFVVCPFVVWQCDFTMSVCLQLSPDLLITNDQHNPQLTRYNDWFVALRVWPTCLVSLQAFFLLCAPLLSILFSYPHSLLSICADFNAAEIHNNK